MVWYVVAFVASVAGWLLMMRGRGAVPFAVASVAGRILRGGR